MLLMERDSICFPLTGTKAVMKKGNRNFPAELQRLYPSAESDALESLINLKRDLAVYSNDDFWAKFTEGLSAILGAEMSFVAKRMLVDDEDNTVEMPPIGQHGSCLMASAMFFRDKMGEAHCFKGFKYHAYACPCAYMQYDKVFLIPENLNDFITENPNTLPIDAEAYIAIPLYSEGKCIGHFGVLWSTESAAARKLSWAFTELLLHALEDLVLQRTLQGSDFVSNWIEDQKKTQQPVSQDAVMAAQSLRPYAGSLSHELRTPMQGVVGMLDVMYTTVEECAENIKDQEMRVVFENLKLNIEVVQDSSRRAVEAADNVVHAYDMDMSVPEGVADLQGGIEAAEKTSQIESKPEIFVAGSNLPLTRPRKRRLGEAFSQDNSRHSSDAGTYKAPRLQCENCAPRAPQLKPEPSHELQQGLHEAGHLTANELSGSFSKMRPAVHQETESPIWRTVAPGVRHTNLRDVLRYVIDEGLKMGGRPEYVAAQETELGEVVQVRTRGSDGQISSKTIEWTVEANVPDTLYIDEKDLGKLISCVFLNAIKFTDHDQGRISVHAKHSQHKSGCRYVIIQVSDNGPGIPKTFLPRLFKAFSQQNSSLTRQSDGLGLGLMVAKGIARKLGGELICARAETDGPGHGTTFEITVPLMAGEFVSRSSSPFGSPMPRQAYLSKPELPHTPPQIPEEWNSIPKGLRERDIPNFDLSVPNQFSSPPSPKTQVKSDPVQPQPRTLASAIPSKPVPRDNQHQHSRPRKLSVPEIDRHLASKHPLTFLVVEDNKINRRLLVSMLNKFGYKNVHEAHDGVEAVRQMAKQRAQHEQVDVILMDLWMPLMDGFQACEEILAMSSWQTNSFDDRAKSPQKPTVLAVTADVTDGAVERAAKVGMKGFMSKPYKMKDLQRLITEYCASSKLERVLELQGVVSA